MHPLSIELFGLHIHRSTTTTDWPRLTFGTWRLWDTAQWADIEPERGRMDFRQLDTLVALNAAHGNKDLVFVFGRVPSWASAKPAAPCAYANGARAPIAVLTRGDGIVTVRTTSAIDVRAGEGVGIGGVADTSFDGGFTAQTTANARTFTYRQPGPDRRTTGGTLFRQGGCAGPVADVEDLAAFAHALVQRYCGVIRYWELWNEPNQPEFWAGSLSALVRQSAVVYRTIKDQNACSVGGRNPNVVLSPSPSEIRSTWLYDWLTQGGAAYSDVIAFHGYTFTREPEAMPFYIRRVRAWADAAGRRDADLWDTEGSWGDDGGVDARQRAGWLARAYVLHAASGVSRFIWYAYDNARFGTLWEQGRGQSQSSDAFTQVQQWLTGARLEPCETRAGTWTCRLSRPGGYAGAIVWNPQAAAPIPMRVRDLLPSAREWRDLSGRRHVVSGETFEVDRQPRLLANSHRF